MRKTKKIVVVALAVAMLALAAVAGTLAWLHDNEIISGNVLSYGDVEIALAATNYTDIALLPGRSYEMNPTITVLDSTETNATNEDAFIRVLVTVNGTNELVASVPTDATYYSTYVYDIGGVKVFALQNCVSGWSDDVWQAYGAEVDTVANKTIYEFRYVGAKSTDGYVPGVTVDTALEAVFANFTVPTYMNNDNVASLENLTIKIEGQAMQAVETSLVAADGTVTDTPFTSADAAWAEFDSQVSGAINNPNSTTVSLRTVIGADGVANGATGTTITPAA